MADAWNDIQALKNRQTNMRAKMMERRRQREGLAAELTSSGGAPSIVPPSHMSGPVPEHPGPGIQKSMMKLGPEMSASPGKQHHMKEMIKMTIDPEVEKKMLMVLCDISLDIPSDSKVIAEHTSRLMEREVDLQLVEELLKKFAAQKTISVKVSEGLGGLIVSSLDLSKLSAMTKGQSKKRRRDSDDDEEEEQGGKQSKSVPGTEAGDIESLLSMQTTKEREEKKLNEEIQALLVTQTAKEQYLVEKFKSRGGPQLQEFCQYGTREECQRTGPEGANCKRLHFKKIIHKHTDESLGDCSFLNTCFHMDTCKDPSNMAASMAGTAQQQIHPGTSSLTAWTSSVGQGPMQQTPGPGWFYDYDNNSSNLYPGQRQYVHYEIDYPQKLPSTELMKKEASLGKLPSEISDEGSVQMFPPQWIQCDLRYFDMSTLGKCAVVMADPPWDIHMELPYGTMGDNEMRRLDIPGLQDEGFIFLWVTGRAMELGRECLELWGYKRVDEIIWVKTNQLQRIIRTGRTGHWINHGKEHCLVGVKGNPKGVNKGMDCDVIVAEVRATSHKPDEIYGIIERLSPGTRKVELFGRPHNVQPNWITLGNQLEGVRLKDPDIVKLFREKYPDGNCMGPPQNR